MSDLAIVEFGGSGPKMTIFKQVLRYKEDPNVPKITNIDDIIYTLSENKDIINFTVIVSSGFVEKLSKGEYVDLLPKINSLKTHDKYKVIPGNPVDLYLDNYKKEKMEFVKFEGRNECKSYNLASHFGNQNYSYVSMGSTTIQFCEVNQEDITIEGHNILDSTDQDLNDSVKEKLEAKIGKVNLVLAGNFTASIFHPKPRDNAQKLMNVYLDSKLNQVREKEKNPLLKIEKNDKMSQMEGAENDIEKGYGLILDKAEEKNYNLLMEKDIIPPNLTILTKINKDKKKVSFSEGVKIELVKLSEKIIYNSDKIPLGLVNARKAELGGEGIVGGKRTKRRRTRRNKSKKNKNKSKSKNRKNNSKGRKSKKYRR